MLQNQQSRVNRWIDYLDAFDRLGWRDASKLLDVGLKQQKNMRSIRRTFPNYIDMNVFMDALETHDTLTANMLTIARHYYPDELSGKPDSRATKQLKMLEDDLIRTLRSIQDNMGEGRSPFVTDKKMNHTKMLIYFMHFNRILNSRHYEAIKEAWRMTEDDFIRNYIFVIMSKAGLHPKSKEEGKIQIKTGDDGLGI